MSQNINTQQTTLESNESIGPKPLGTVLDETEVEEQEVLGHMMYCTTGEIICSHEWLADAFRRHNIPPQFLPDLPAKWSAYTRAMRYLIHPGVSDEWEVNGRKVNVEMRNGEGKAKFIEAHEFIPEDESNVEDGEWQKNNLGKINYDKEQQKITYQSLMEGYDYADIWGALVERSEQLFNRMQTSIIDSDMRKLIAEIRDYSNSIPLRDAGVVYFFPSHHSGLLEGLSAVWNEMDNASGVTKMGGEKSKDIEMRTTVVFNSDEKRNLVERQVERRVEDEVNDALTDAFSRLSNDENVEKIVEGVIDTVKSSSDVTEEYNLLLGSKLSVERILQDMAEDMAKERHEEFVEELENEVDNE